MNTITKRIKRLRNEMKASGVQAFYISGTDPHQSEYVPEYWESRSFITGFSGSAGVVLVTLEDAALWTDSRYFLQAEKELSDTGVKLMRQREASTPSPIEWLGRQLTTNDKLGIDSSCISIDQFENFKQELAAFKIDVCPVKDLLTNVWTDRPQLPENKIFEHEERFTDKSRIAKIEEIRKQMHGSAADFVLITALDDLAWTFNLRGSDVDYNPVFLGYAIIGKDNVHLFVNDGKLTKELSQKLTSEGITLHAYHGINSFLENIDQNCKLLVDTSKTNQRLMDALPSSITTIRKQSIPTKLKAVKTSKEIQHIQYAMRKDGAAMVEFLYWLDKAIGKLEITELDVAKKLQEIRSRQADFFGESFFPIVGYLEHGAIVHYHVTEQTAKAIHPKGFLLVDSGGQYMDGTTDITRTIALSEPSAEEKRDFTLVLKGMIALSQATFPEGTKGCNLDILARQALWQRGLNYGHGTGHGVGYFLNVHEGPMSIRQDFNEHAICPGMVISNEPGLYREGEYGIRTENLIVCVEKNDIGYGKFYGFKTLTLCPIDLKAVDISLMNNSEIDWLNNYHKRVFEEVSPLLSNELREYLKQLIKPIN